MKKKRGLLKTYLLLALAFGLFGLLDALLTFFDVVTNVYVYLAFVLPFLFFVFSIVVIPIFHHHRLERIVYVLPIYHIISYVIFFAFAFILSVVFSILLYGLSSLMLSKFTKNGPLFLYDKVRSVIS